MNSLKDYNIKELNFNIILDSIIIDINKFIETYNIDINILNKDTKNILLHVILDNIIKEIDNFSCILFYNEKIFSQEKNLNQNLVDIIVIQLYKACKKLNIPIVKVDDNFSFNLQDIYNFKKLLQEKKPINVRKIKKFLSDNNLIFLEKRVSSDRTLQKNLIK